MPWRRAAAGASPATTATDPHDAPFDPSKIDLVAIDPNRTTVELFLLNDLGWTASDAQLDSLQAKLNAYIHFAVDGHLAATYPTTKGLPWAIVVMCRAGLPDVRTTFVLDQFTSHVRTTGGALHVRSNVTP